MKNKILNIGPLTKDIIKTTTDEYSQIGGSVFYQSFVLHQLKVPSTSIIIIGKDDLELLESFPNTENIKIIKKDKSMEYTNIYDEKLQRIQKAKLPKNTVTLDEIEELNLNLSEYEYVILSPLSKYDFSIQTIKYFKDANLTTVLLPQGYLREVDSNDNVIKSEWKDFDIYLKYVDILCLDSEETKTLFQIETINKAVIHSIIHKYDLDRILITQAERGSTIYTKKDEIKIKAIKTDEEIDPTGLGDTYITAYIIKKIEGYDDFEAGLFASLTCKNKLEHKGPLKTTKEELEKEYENIKVLHLV